ncbi:hypothetical protein AAMO2058_000126000 [Amorphochlora amoebiformis]
MPALPWYEDFDPFNRPRWDKKTTSYVNYIIAFVLAVSIATVTGFLINEFYISRVTSVNPVGNDDFTSGEIPSGFKSSDGNIFLEVTAIRKTSGANSPDGSDNTLEFVPFTTHSYSCDTAGKTEHWPGGTWASIGICSRQSDCRLTSVNASSSIDAVFLVRGSGDYINSNQKRFRNVSITNAFEASRSVGVDTQLGMIVNRYFVEGRVEYFVYQSGMERYNSHRTENNATTCSCANTLCPPYLRFNKLAITTLIGSDRGSELDFLATVVGFSTGFWKLGIPLGIVIRFLLGPKITAWECCCCISKGKKSPADIEIEGVKGVSSDNDGQDQDLADAKSPSYGVSASARGTPSAGPSRPIVA